jgi:hypothetical protein
MIIITILNKVEGDDCDMRTAINLLTKEYNLPYLQAYALRRRNEHPNSKSRITLFTRLYLIRRNHKLLLKFRIPRN